jgi:phosphoglycolate phosphatase-like HAD superfamily hydrolase
MPRPQIIFLDFDGVIMDSMDLKLDSYCHAFEGCGFQREAIHAMQLASAGLSRSKTIPLIYLALSGKPMPEALFQSALERFTEHDEASRGAMVLKQGALEFLEAARAKRIYMAVVTGTPQEVIDRTIEQFKLGVYFLKVCGSPGSKVEHVETLLSDYRLDAEECLFVGDAIKDQEAAVATKVPFIGLNNGDDPFLAAGLYKEIRALDEIIPLLS